MRINKAGDNYKKQQNFKALTGIAKPLGMFYNPNATIPTLIIESGVTSGRTFSAYKKSGKIEATERLVEQGTSAVVWLWGVQAFKKIGDIIGKNILKIKDLNFDVGFDYLRNPLENISKKAIAYKTGNILTSTFLATVFIGFILPKINHLITNKTLKNENKNNKTEYTSIKPTTIEDYKKKTSANISFTSLFDNAKSFAHIIENDSTKRLLITDSGVIAGRFHNGRNKYEKIENIFRDVTSIYFYLFSTKHTVNLLNKLTSNTNINPKVLNVVKETLEEQLEKSQIDKYNFKINASGKANAKNLRKIDKLFENKKVIEADTFKKLFPDFSAKTDSISSLQPELNGKKLITYLQAKDIVSNGWINDDKFLHKIYNEATNGNYNKKEKFISAKEIDNIRLSVDKFIEQIDNEAKKQDGALNKQFIQKIANKTLYKNFAYYMLGTGISIFALGILIPKIQYLIRRKLTNNDEFVGIKKYE